MARATLVRSSALAAAALCATAVFGGSLHAQAGTAATAPEVGQMAPDFTLPGATRYGLLKAPVKLSELRGQTVVIAFFPKARTKG